MSVETALYTRLTTHEGLKALIGARAYPLRLPQEPTLPAVTYRRISGAHIQELGGPAALAQALFQVSCWGATYASAAAVATQARLALDGYVGALGSCAVTGQRDLMDPEPERYQCVLEAVVWHQEATT